MKDIVIKENHIRRELWIFLACLAVMEVINIFAIVKYDGSWVEVFKSLGFVAVAGVVTYLVVALIRILIFSVLKLIKR